MSIGVGELLLILVIVFVLFGAGKLPQVMNDIGKGVKSLKRGLKAEEDTNSSPKVDVNSSQEARQKEAEQKEIGQKNDSKS